MIDYDRRSLLIPRRLMPSLLAAHGGSRPDASSLDELQASGLIASHRLDPLVRSLIDVMTNPKLVVTAEVIRGHSPTSKPARLATFWRNGRRAVLGLTGDGNQFQLVEIEAALLPFHIAQAVELVPRRQPRFSGSFAVPAGVLTKAEELIAVDPQRADVELSAAGVPRVWADRIVAALVLRRSLWVLESVWLGGTNGSEQARLCVLDGGFSGYWRLAESNDITVSPADFDELIHRIGALLP
jgi:hypothetical protein